MQALVEGTAAITVASTISTPSSCIDDFSTSINPNTFGTNDYFASLMPFDTTYFDTLTLKLPFNAAYWNSLACVGDCSCPKTFKFFLNEVHLGAASANHLPQIDAASSFLTFNIGTAYQRTQNSRVTQFKLRMFNPFSV